MLDNIIYLQWARAFEKSVIHYYHYRRKYLRVDEKDNWEHSFFFTVNFVLMILATQKLPIGEGSAQIAADLVQVQFFFTSAIL